MMTTVGRGALERGAGRRASVSIVDTGFSWVPPYAELHGRNPLPGHFHGNRVLSVFAAPDALYPMSNLELHLACAPPNSGYDGVMLALSLLPETDVVSLSMSWKDDAPELRELLRSKAPVVLCPHTSGTPSPYPSAYRWTTPCSDRDERTCKICISPVQGWNGASYAVPAAARLMAHCPDFRSWEAPDGGVIGVRELFAAAKTMASSGGARADAPVQAPSCCRSCGRRLDWISPWKRGPKCPFCGMRA